MHGQRGIVIIDLEKNRVTVGFEGSEIVFLMRVVGVAKEHLAGLQLMTIEQATISYRMTLERLGQSID